MTRRTMVGVAGATLMAPISPIVGKSLTGVKKALDVESGSINVTAYKYLMFVDPAVIRPEVLDEFPDGWPETLVIFTNPHAPRDTDPIRLYKL